MIAKFKSYYHSKYFDQQKNAFLKSEFSSFYDLCFQKVKFHSAFSKLSFSQFYPYLQLQFNHNQLDYLNSFKITKEEELYEAARNYDACEEIKKRIAEEKRIQQEKEELGRIRKETENQREKQMEKDKQILANANKSKDKQILANAAKTKDSDLDVSKEDMRDCSNDDLLTYDSDSDLSIKSGNSPKLFTRNFYYKESNSFPLIDKEETLKRKKQSKSNQVQISLEKRIKVVASSKDYLNSLFEPDSFDNPNTRLVTENRMLQPIDLSISDDDQLPVDENEQHNDGNNQLPVDENDQLSVDENALIDFY